MDLVRMLVTALPRSTVWTGGKVGRVRQAADSLLRSGSRHMRLSDYQHSSIVPFLLRPAVASLWRGLLFAGAP
jgi:hypothetical protein